MLKPWKTALLAIVAVLCCASLAMAEPARIWDLVDPSGVIQRDSVAPAPRLASLDGKTIVLRWNGKYNGDIVLNHMAELLAKAVPTAEIVKSYELDPSINQSAASPSEADRHKSVILGMKPDIVIGSQGD